MSKSTQIEPTPIVDFAARLIAWYRSHGRHDLPWQRSRDAYPIWVSEVMLQQTQVVTVIAYFERFMARFPTVSVLAAASEDEVMAHWAGLGYYRRARHLHHGAQVVCAAHGGSLPADVDALMALPGIGRSTAGAIMALAFGERHPILDGNVKRVLARLHALNELPSTSAGERIFWRLADVYTPQIDVDAYTQAIMDLGATLCTRVKPSCEQCPFVVDCVAYAQGEVERYPLRAARKSRPTKSTRMLLIRNAQSEYLLQRQPPSGVWGGLWSLPQCAADETPEAWCRSRLGLEVKLVERWPQRRHQFTHFELRYEPILLAVVGLPDYVAEDDCIWYNRSSPPAVGLPQPVTALLAALPTSD
jgi:A/G-specific adenine glycosylase